MQRIAPFLIILLMLAAGAWLFFIQKPADVHELPPPPTAQDVSAEPRQISTAVEPSTPESLDAPAFEQKQEIESSPELDSGVPAEPLPALSQSDEEVKQVLATMVGEDPLAQYLVQSEVISRFVASVDRLTSRQVPPLINPISPVGDDFIVDVDGERMLMSPRNFARYDGHISLLQNANSDALVAAYRRYYPLFQEAFEQNGGEGSFNDRLREVIDQLLDTPDVPGPVYLLKPEAVFVFEEPELEALNAGQKVLVRMGSVNAAMVKQKLQEIRAALPR